jgi:hypothetical protein
MIVVTNTNPRLRFAWSSPLLLRNLAPLLGPVWTHPVHSAPIEPVQLLLARPCYLRWRPRSPSSAVATAGAGWAGAERNHLSPLPQIRRESLPSPALLIRQSVSQYYR